MKKGISLIVLVITILVLAILAGAVIISLSNTNVIEQSSAAVHKTDIASAKDAILLEYMAAVARGQASGKATGYAYQTDNETVMTATQYMAAVDAAGLTGKVTQAEVLASVDTTTGAPTFATVAE